MKMLVFSEWLLLARTWRAASSVCASSRVGAEHSVRRKALSAIEGNAKAHVPLPLIL